MKLTKSRDSVECVSHLPHPVELVLMLVLIVQDQPVPAVVGELVRVELVGVLNVLAVSVRDVPHPVAVLDPRLHYVVSLFGGFLFFSDFRKCSAFEENCR